MAAQSFHNFLGCGLLDINHFFEVSCPFLGGGGISLGHCELRENLLMRGPAVPECLEHRVALVLNFPDPPVEILELVGHRSPGHPVAFLLQLPKCLPQVHGIGVAVGVGLPEFVPILFDLPLEGGHLALVFPAELRNIEIPVSAGDRFPLNQISRAPG